MKQNEQINNWIGSIILMFSVLFIVSFTPHNQDSSNSNKSFKSDQFSTNNDTGINLEPLHNNQSHEGFVKTDILHVNQTNFVSLQSFIKDKTELNLKIASDNFENQKPKICSMQLVDSIANEDDFIIS